jgi:outer membrane autotransporter protein
VALLLAAPAKAGETITTPQASVTNPAGATTSFISITGTSVILGSTVTGGIVNSGTITATGKTGIGVQSASPIGGGITNTGMISGSTSAIDLSLETGGSTVVHQAGGALIGAVKLSATADVLSFTGGTISGAVTGVAGNQDLVAISGEGAVFTPTASVSVVSAFTQGAGSRLTLQVTPAQAPSISAGAISLGGTLNIALLGNLAGFGTGKTYKDVFVSVSQIAGSFASVTTTAPIFTASVTPDAVTANALDVNLALSQTGLAASAQDLTQSSQLGLDAPRVLTQAVQDRLVTNGGALGESAAANAGQKGVAGFSLGNANVWARGYDQFGSASGTGAAPGYDINRAAPFIAGIDWRFDNNIVAGVAATYVATSASFKDGSHTNVDSYQGGAYVGWAGGPWYALGSAVVSFNDFSTSRLLTPFGLPGEATSSPSGQSYQGHAEAGYHWGLPAAGTNISVTPYAALDYVNAHISGFSETGGFGALSVNAADSNSFQTTLGVRLTSRIQMGNMGTLIPELRLGWNHEFLDTSQSLTAALVGVPGSTFSGTGINFGRDAALIGGGFSMELSPDAKVFVDYDGKLSQRFQEHSISGGLRVRF